LLLYNASIVTVKWNIVTMTNWVPTLAPDRPRYVAIADAIASDLSAGRLSAGERLPPQRELAWKLGVTVGTVTRAYQEAEKRGLLTGEVGRGSFLRDPKSNLLAVKNLAAGTDPGILDMQMATPPRVYSQAEFEAALREISHDPGFEDLLDYGPAGGYPQHRALGSRWLERAGLEIPPDRVVISAGAQACLMSCLSTIASHGERMFIEPWSYPTMRLIARQLGLNLRPLEADADGILPDSLESMARRGEAKLLYLVPTLHNPTTVTLSIERREAIAEIAKRHDLKIIEDDVFRYLAEAPPPTIYSLAPERTYYIQSVSKTMAAGLRIGFMALPSEAGSEVVRQQLIVGGRPVGLALEVARHWIDNGIADRILSSIKSELLARRELAVEILDGYSAQCEPGAMYVWLGLPSPWRAAEFAAAAHTVGVKLTPGPAFAMDHAAPRAVRATLGPAASQDALRDGLVKLRKLLDRGPVEDFQTMA
jgi:DNA-binding transcriptional MocR family regulator